MRILFIANYSQLYGANRSLLTLIKYLNQKGEYELQVFLPSKGDLVQELEKLNVKNKIIPYFSSFLYLKISLKYLLFPILLLLDIIIFPILLYQTYRNKPDLIYSNTSAENMGVLISKILGIKHISHIREFMFLDHRAYFIGGDQLKRKYINMSEGVIFVSKSVANHVMQGKIDDRKHIVIYNGLKSEALIENNKQLDKNKTINWGIVGILDEGKQQHLAVKYFKDVLIKYPNSILNIYGDKDGSYKKKIEKIIEETGIKDKVIFHGFISNIEVIYTTIDILLMFSKSEGFGRVTVEAMQRGVPVIGYNNAGTAEIIEDGISGYLFDDKESFLDSIDKILLSSNYSKIRNIAIEKANSNFSELLYCEKIEKYINYIS